NNPTPTSYDIEAALDGNLCRCTGMRPISTAVACFASDAEEVVENWSPPEQKWDAEAEEGARPFPEALIGVGVEPVSLLAVRENEVGEEVYRHVYVRPTSLAELSAAHGKYPKARMIGGCTEYSLLEAPMSDLIELKSVREMNEVEYKDTVLTVGGSTTLRTLVSLLSTTEGAKVPCVYMVPHESL
ncbi:hypothetical protein KIPB_014620, partial [Kipferlia bialata]